MFYVYVTTLYPFCSHALMCLPRSICSCRRSRCHYHPVTPIIKTLNPFPLPNPPPPPSPTQLLLSASHAIELPDDPRHNARVSSFNCSQEPPPRKLQKISATSCPSSPPSHTPAAAVATSPLPVFRGCWYPTPAIDEYMRTTFVPTDACMRVIATTPALANARLHSCCCVYISQ